MDAKGKLGELRRQIDAIDERLAPLFAERMEVSRRVAEVKGQNNMAVVDEPREQQVVDHAAALVPEDMRGETALLMRALLALSRERQRGLLFGGEEPLLPPPAEPRRGDVACAYQGVPGAWSEQALMKLFPDARREAMEFFEDVFVAVREGRADYGVVPIENSKTGAIGETYDLLRKYGCFVVGRTWVNIHHCHLAPGGVGLADVREVFSHPEGFKQ
ncbi:MAG: chorismate mutase, partial [Oscillospiraceae bacterium]|nr:chorismate mutase [Oscillospiraceae bacterium]